MGIYVQHGRKGSKCACREEDDTGKRVAGRSRRERHCVPDLWVLAWAACVDSEESQGGRDGECVRARGTLTVDRAVRTMVGASTGERGEKHERIVILHVVVMILKQDDGVGGADCSRKRGWERERERHHLLYAHVHVSITVERSRRKREERTRYSLQQWVTASAGVERMV
jgi:hypothetical protein